MPLLGKKFLLFTDAGRLSRCRCLLNVRDTPCGHIIPFTTFLFLLFFIPTSESVCTQSFTHHTDHLHDSNAPTCLNPET